MAQWSALQPVGRGFGPRPSPTKDVKKWYSLPSHLAPDKREWSGKVKHPELPVDQPPAVAFTAFTDVWSRATETEIGAALCAIGAERTLTFTF